MYMKFDDTRGDDPKVPAGGSCSINVFKKKLRRTVRVTSACDVLYVTTPPYFVQHTFRFSKMGRSKQTARKSTDGRRPPRRQLPRSDIHKVDTALLLRAHVATKARKVRTLKFLIIVFNRKSADQKVNEKWKSVVDEFTNSFLHGANIRYQSRPRFFHPL